MQKIGNPLFLLLLSFFLPASVHAEAEIAWQLTEGFKNPESAAFDPERKVLYVSNVNGDGTAADGNGFISKVSPDGSVSELEWVTGLNGPKGLAVAGDKLYVSDITELVEIDIESGSVANKYPAANAKFLNDVAADGDNVYVSDMVTNTIHRLSNGEFTAWVNDENLDNPNGLLVQDSMLVVGSWGKMNPDFSTDVPGHMKSVDLDSGEINSIGSGEAVGNLDGVEPDGNGNWFVTDWVAGTLYRISPDGSAEMLVDLNKGSADIEYLPETDLVIVPMMMDNSVVAYKVGL